MLRPVSVNHAARRVSVLGGCGDILQCLESLFESVNE